MVVSATASGSRGVCGRARRCRWTSWPPDPEDLDLAQLDQLLNAGVPQLPTDPDRLERLIRAYAEKKDPPVEAAMFNEISGLLHSPFASGKLRAALYRVLTGIEGVELVGQRRDADGRVGTAISAPAGYGGPNDRTPDPQVSTLNTQLRRYLIIDPRDRKRPGGGDGADRARRLDRRQAG